MTAADWTGILHYGWTRGFATVVEAPSRRTAAVFGPAGWKQGDPSSVLPGGAPPGSEAVRLALPEWLADQVTGLQFSSGGLHTEFVRLRSLLQRLCTQGPAGVVFVLGESPAVFVVAEGKVVPVGADALPPEEAQGWIAVFSGKVRLPEAPPGHVAPPAVLTEPAGDAAPKAAEEVYFVPRNCREVLPDKVVDGILKVAGPAGKDVPALLDGSRTLAAIAGMTGLTPGQARAVVEVLAAHRLAFRCFGRTMVGSSTQQGSSGQS